MKKVVPFILKRLSIIAFSTAVASANVACGHMYHQPKLPASVRSLRRL